MDLINVTKLTPQVWPYLLGYHKFGSTPDERADEDRSRAEEYHKLLTEWTNVEVLLRQRSRNAETDGDSTVDSMGSKEDIFNENVDNEETKIVSNGSNTPETDAWCNGQLTSGYSHKESEKTPPNSEFDDESGCYDCGEDTNKKLNLSTERCTLCGLEINGHSTEISERLTNGCHNNGQDVDENHVGERTYCTCGNNSNTLSRLSSYSVCFARPTCSQNL